MKLYEMPDTMKLLLELTEQQEDDTEAWSAALADLADAFEDKIVNLAKLVRTWEAEEEAYKTEIDRLQAHRKTAQNKQDWAKRYIQENMEQMGVEQVKGPTLNVRLQNSPPSVEVTDPMKCPATLITAMVSMPFMELPDELRERATLVVDKRALLDMWKTTGDVGDGAVVHQGKHVRLR